MFQSNINMEMEIDLIFTEATRFFVQISNHHFLRLENYNSSIINKRIELLEKYMRNEEKPI